MNRRANLYLNIYGILSFIFSLACLGITLISKELTYNFPTMIKLVFLLLGILSGILFISIEAFLFILMNNKSRFIYIGYILLELIISVLINVLLPFSAFLIFIVLKITKDCLRIKLVDKIYMPKEFDRYCKMFNIKVSDFRKKRVTTTKSKTKEKIKISVEDDIKEEQTQRKTKRTKTPALEKAI